MSASSSAFPALNENCAASEVSSVPPVSLEHVILPQDIQDDVHAVAKDMESLSVDPALPLPLPLVALTPTADVRTIRGTSASGRPICFGNFLCSII